MGQGPQSWKEYKTMLLRINVFLKNEFTIISNVNLKVLWIPVNEADICVHEIIVHIVKITQWYTTEI